MLSPYENVLDMYKDEEVFNLFESRKLGGEEIEIVVSN